MPSEDVIPQSHRKWLVMEGELSGVVGLHPSPPRPYQRGGYRREPGGAAALEYRPGAGSEKELISGAGAGGLI